MTTKVVIFAQQKGGVGKTTDTVMSAVIAAETFNKKVLMIDTDLQHNATEMVSKTYNHYDYDFTLMSCLTDGDLEKGITKLSDNFDLLPGGYDMRDFGTFLDDKFSNVIDRTFYFSKLLARVKDKYDYVFIDVPPSTDIKVDNAMVCADYVVIVQEMKQFAFDGSKTLVSAYLQTLVNDFGEKITTQIAGVLPVLFDPRSKIQTGLMKDVRAYFGDDNVFNSIIRRHDRLEVYGAQGVQFEDYHDKQMFALYADIFAELEERINIYDNTGDIVNYTYQPKYRIDNKVTPAGKELTANGLVR